MVNDPNDQPPDFTLLGKYFTGEAGPEEAMRFDEWRLQNPAEYQRMEKLWKETRPGTNYTAPDTATAWSGWIARPQTRRLPVFWRLGVAAGILLPLLFAGYKMLHRKNLADAATGKVMAMSTMQQLPDRSVVHLKKGSAVIYPPAFSIDERRVLLQGEGYFSVAHDSKRPFIVEAGEVTLTDLGTRFNTRIDRAYITAEVDSGAIEMADAFSRLRVNAGQTGVYDRRTHRFLGTDTVDRNAHAYATQSLYFYDRPLADVAVTLEHYYQVKIIFTPAALGRCKLTTEFVQQPSKMCWMSLLPHSTCTIQSWRIPFGSTVVDAIKCSAIILLVLTGLSVQAQSVSTHLRFPVRFPQRLMRMDSLAAFVRRETGFIFAYNSGRISPAQEVSIPPGTRDVEHLLCLLEKTRQFRFTLHCQYIVLRYERASRPLAKSSRRPDTAPVKPISFSAVIQPESVADRSEATHPASIIHYSPRVRTIGSSAVAAIRPGAAASAFSFRAEAGLGLSEIYYFNPTVRAGFPWLYGIASYNSNGRVSGIRYGFGFTKNLSDALDLYGSATFGGMSRHFASKFVDTAFAPALTIHGSLTSLSIGLSRVFNRRWRVEFGPVYNILSTRYADSTGAATLFNPVYSENYTGAQVSNPDDTYYVIKAPYVLKNSFSLQKSENRKSWIGVQLAIYFQLFEERQ